MVVTSVKNRGVVVQVLLPSLLINLLSLAVPLTVLQIYDRILPNQSYGTATLLIAGALLAVAMEALIRFVRTWLLSAAASNTEKATYQAIATKITKAPPRQIRQVGVGGVEEGLGSVSKVKDWYSGGVIAGFIDLPFALIFLGLVAYIGGELVAIPIAVWLFTLGIVWISSQKVKVLSEHASAHEQQRKAFLVLMIQTIQGIKRQAIESRIFSQFKLLNHYRSQSKAEEEKRNAFAQECIQLAALATSVLLVIAGSLWVLDGELTTGGLAACSILSGRAVAPLSALVGVRIKLNSIHTANQAIENLSHLDSPSDQDTHHQAFETLAFQNIVIERYGKTHQVSLEASQGQLILLDSEDRHVSSHMLSSMAGVDELVSGDIKLNQNPINTDQLSSLIAFCGAKAQLVSGTILDNLCGFNPEHTNRANEYAKRLGLTKEITRLPEGLETRVGHSSAALLSMGNLKMLNIAAQLASGKPIVMLERPDTSLDLDALGKLIEVIEQDIKQGRSIVMVTHYSKLRELANQIIEVQPSVKEGEAA